MRPAEALKLTSDERTSLEQVLDSPSPPQKVAFRIRIVLGASEGISNNELARRFATTRTTVLKWRGRFANARIEGILTDAPGRGRKKKISPDQEAAMVEAALKTKPAEAAHWSTRTMAAAQGVSASTVLRIWRAHRLEPHRVEKLNQGQPRSAIRRQGL